MRIGQGTFAVITGGAGGIGSAVATELSGRGAAVAVVDIDGARLNEIAARLPRATIRNCDVADTRSMESLASTIAAAHPEVDVLAMCAGLSVSGTIEELPIEQIERCMAVNVTGVVNSFRAFLPLLRAAAAVKGRRRLATFSAISHCCRCRRRAPTPHRSTRRSPSAKHSTPKSATWESQ